MKLKKSLFSIFMLSLVTTTACGTSQSSTAIPENAQFVKVDAVKADSNKPVVYVADLAGTAQGIKGGASFSVKINFPGDSFNTKGSSNGYNTESIQTLRVNLSTSATTPFTSRALTDGILVTRTGLTSGTAATVVFTNVAAGTYYATVTAFDKAIGNVASTASATEGIVTANNSGTPYTSTDSGARIAVSTNSATVSSALALTFSDSPNNKLDVTAKIEVKGAVVDTEITPTDNNAVGSLNAS